MSSVDANNKVHPSVESNPRCPTIACPACGSSFSPSGRRTYCSDACRALAYRRRRSGMTRQVRVPKSQPRREITVYECDTCGERSLGEQRCPQCHTFMRRVGIGGHCPSCEESITISELIGTGFIVEP
jgi:predicted nucleic acid-binding Zn ribbon protein